MTINKQYNNLDSFLDLIYATVEIKIMIMLNKKEKKDN